MLCLGGLPDFFRFAHSDLGDGRVKSLCAFGFFGITVVNTVHTGHPIEYIDIDTRNLHKPQTCKYCGLRFIKKGYLDKSSQH